jgi:SRSO17 transposase
MAFMMGTASVARLKSYFEETIGQHLHRAEQRASFAMYAFGLLSDGERKSVEPMAARACGNPDECRATEERMLHFVSKSPWNDRDVRREAALYVTRVMGEREPVTTWIIDDTGFLKQGVPVPAC